ncbi:MAG: shikimate kinase [Paludibacteraceae bacterium]
MEQPLRIFLVGFMGCGKSTIGRRLADALGWSCIDTDAFIEGRYHKTVSQIFEEKGEAGFRQIERAVLLELSDYERVVIATGGGLACFADNMQQMNACGLTVYLRTPVPLLVERLTHAKVQRPLLRGKSRDELTAFVDNLLAQRTPFYEQAAMVVDVETDGDFAHIDDFVRTLGIGR